MRLHAAIKQTLEIIGVRELLIELPKVLKRVPQDRRELFISILALMFPLSWIPDDIAQGTQVQYVMCRGMRYPCKPR